MHRRRWTFHLAWLLPLAAVAAAYGSLHGRGFTSEDFLLIRVLRESPPWQDLRSWLAGPWLGIDVVRFYRPVAVGLLALEARLFGGNPVPYNVLHLGFHAINVLLVFDLAAALARSAGRAPALPAGVAALLFALHPLHPNAVAWIASYATLFAATGVLAAAVAWEGWRRRRGGTGLWVASLSAWLLALGCYEAAVVLPAVLLVREVADRSRRAWAVLPFFAVAGLYLLFRRTLFGEVVGGYGAFAERLDWSGLGGLATDAVRSLYLLFDPSPPVPGLALAAVLVGVAALAGPLAEGLLRSRAAAGSGGITGFAGRDARRRRDGEAAAGAFHGGGRWVYSWTWMVLFLAPFLFQPFVPATGRFAYLAAVGTALVLGQWAGLAAGRVEGAGDAGAGPGALGERDAAESAGRERRDQGAGGPSGLRRAAGFTVRLALVVVVLVVGVRWSVALGDHVEALERAAAEAATVSDALAALESPDRPALAGDAPLFVAGHPRFVLDAAGTPVAQVLRYGLADSVRPPFRSASLRVYPLPEGGAEDLRAAEAALSASLPNAAFRTWNAENGDFQSASETAGGSPPPPPPASLQLLHPPVPEASPTVALRPLENAARYRLVVVTPGNPAVADLATEGGEIRGVLPQDFLRSMSHLYPSPAWWWIEARTADGTVLAVTPARPWPSDAPP